MSGPAPEAGSDYCRGGSHLVVGPYWGHICRANSITELSTWYSGASLCVSRLELLPYPYFTPQPKWMGSFLQPISDGWIHRWAAENSLHSTLSPILLLQGPSFPPLNLSEGLWEGVTDPVGALRRKSSLLFIRLTTSFGRLLCVLTLTRSVFCLI